MARHPFRVEHHQRMAWQRQLGSPAVLPSAAAIPEPPALSIGVASWLRWRAPQQTASLAGGQVARSR